MVEPLLPPPERISGVREDIGDLDWLTAPRGYDRSPRPLRQPGGRIHEPWRLTAAEQRELGVVIGRDYPAPVVDHLEAARAARERFHRFRQGRNDLRVESRAIHARHGSRRRRRRSGLAKGPQRELPVDRD